MRLHHASTRKKIATISGILVSSFATGFLFLALGKTWAESFILNPIVMSGVSMAFILTVLLLKGSPERSEQTK